ncbi:MAG: YeeE/YedE thiosulfate transporter family protein [Victivallaceae bacterium]|nr:YeeE/YedE thiosulfate transporter family protein [Victivallaceae bacterium]
MRFLTVRWPFYACAVAFTLIFLAQFYLLDRPVMLRDGFSTVAEYGEKAVRKHDLRNPPPLSDASGLVIGIVAGGLLGALCDKKCKLKLRPQRTGMFQSAFLGLAGGFLVMLGALIAGDMFLGEIASAIQLSRGAWLFLGAAFVTAGIIAVFAMNSREQRKKGAGPGAGKEQP